MVVIELLICFANGSYGELYDINNFLYGVPDCRIIIYYSHMCDLCHLIILGMSLHKTFHVLNTTSDVLQYIRIKNGNPINIVNWDLVIIKDCYRD